MNQLSDVESSSCPICGGISRQLRVFARLNDETTKLHICSSCNAEFLFPQPSDAWLAKEYEGYFDKRKTSIKQPRKALFETLLSGYCSSVTSPQTILDVGGGEGDCAAAAKALWPSASVTVIEQNQECRSHYAELDCELKAESIETWLTREEESRFDLILAFDLLEHLRSPRDVLSRLVEQKLASSGRMLCTFPNANSLSKKILGRLWQQYKVEHLFYFSRCSVEELATRVGLKTVQLSPLKKCLPIEYLLTIGSNFGPAPVRGAATFLRKALTDKAGKRRISLYLGEWFWMAEHPGS